MVVRERMQVARRRDPYPWTWEPFAGWVLMLAMVLLLGLQVARGLANALAGAGFTWPGADRVVVSVVGVVGGDPAAGLAHPRLVTRQAHLASTGALRVSLVITEVLLLIAYSVVTVVMLRTWGPGRLLGMASREDAERLLGRTRLRRVAGVVRPDLYGTARAVSEAPGRVTTTPGVAYRDAQSDAMSTGSRFSRRFLPVHQHPRVGRVEAIDQPRPPDPTHQTRTWS